MNVRDAIRTRRSARAFLNTPVPRSMIEDILDQSRYAPSGSNFQPWQVYVVAGERRDAIVADALRAFAAGEQAADYAYYPDPIPEPYRARRRATGWGLYSLLGIAKGDRESSRAQHARNYEFFDAPVGLFFFIDRQLELGSWLDYGMFLQNIMLMAREHGLHTCPQASWPELHQVVRRHLPVTDQHTLVCGMALGYADPGDPVNEYQPQRESVESFTQYFGFEADS
jgi:nitroreductase